MRPATLISFVLLCLLGSALPSASAPVNRGSGTPPPAAHPAPAEPNEDETPSNAIRPTATGQQAGRGERRRRSYASCNRESHRRDLRGGARRRFLIRCRLGYERRQPPAQPGKRP